MQYPQSIKDYFLAQYPNEGVVFIKNKEFIKVKNTHKYPTTGFKICPQTYLHYRPDCIIHSHTQQTVEDPRIPSRQDIQLQRTLDIPFAIVYVTENDVSQPLHFPQSLDTTLYGRTYIPVVRDCFHFIKSYFFQEKNILFPDRPLSYCWNKPQDIMPFVKQYPVVPVTEKQTGDILILQQAFGHLAIYLGNNYIGHHLYGRLSRIDKLTHFNKYVTGVFRYAE